MSLERERKESHFFLLITHTITLTLFNTPTLSIINGFEIQNKRVVSLTGQISPNIKTKSNKSYFSTKIHKRNNKPAKKTSARTPEEKYYIMYKIYKQI